MNLKLTIIGLIFFICLPICIAQIGHSEPGLTEEQNQVFNHKSTNTETAGLAYIIGLSAVALVFYKAKPKNKHIEIAN